MGSFPGILPKLFIQGLIALGIICALDATSVVADQRALPEKIDQLVTMVSKRYQIPEPIFRKILRHESLNHPWALCLNGKTLEPESKEEALRILAASETSNYDLGYGQINSYWLRRWGLSPEVVLDPVVNINISGWVLRHCIDQYPDQPWKAVSCYNVNPEKRPDLAIRYLRKAFGQGVN